MIRITARVLTGEIDSEGDRFELKNIDLSRRKIVLFQFDATKAIGEAELYLSSEGDAIYATLELLDDKLPRGIELYPAVGFTAITVTETKAGVRVINEAHLQCISLGLHRNADNNIKPLIF
jgi:hypothetical protein